MGQNSTPTYTVANSKIDQTKFTTFHANLLHLQQK